MLSPEMVQTRRRGEELVLVALKPNERDEALSMAAELLETAGALVGSTQEEVKEALGSLERSPKLEKVFQGLLKLVLDDLSFSAPGELDAVSLRREIFERACQARLAMTTSAAFDRRAVLETVSQARGLSLSDTEEALFSDLKGAQKLLSGPQMSAEGLLERYEIAQVQGVLLRAVRLTVLLEGENPDVVRELFIKLKFRQLLYRIEHQGDGYKIEIDGPFSLFESVTKYGLQLALMVPALLRCRNAKLSAELSWGKDRRRLSFRTELRGSSEEQAGDRPRLRTEVETLYAALRKRDSPISVSVCSSLLEVPGEGLCIPDLVFTRDGSSPVFLEVMGFWSRAAVWKRVEWVQAGASERVLFAVSEKLRVSAEVLEKGSTGALYLYKGVMNPSAVLAHVEKLMADAS